MQSVQVGERGGGPNLKVLLNELKVFSERKRRGVAGLELGFL